MKLYLLAAGAALAIPAAAQAAPAAPTTSGFYIGAHVGYGWTKPDYKEPGYPDYGRNPTVDGFTAGVIAGYDFAAGSMTFGLEGDIGLLDGSEDENSSSPTNDYTAFDNKWNGHLRVKVGVPVGAVNLFAAGGLAVARIEADDTDTDWGGFEKTFTGWTLGAGVEHQVNSRLKVRGEYLHDEFAKENGTVEYLAGSSSYDVSMNPSSDLVRFALLFAL